MTTIHVEAVLPYPSEKVWRALTEPDLLAAWLMPNDFEPRLGHKFTFRTAPATGFDGLIHCQVLKIRPQELLRISWRSSAGLDTTVTWHLTSEGASTRLRLVHDGFDDIDPAQEAIRSMLDDGWREHLARRMREALSSIAEMPSP